MKRNNARQFSLFRSKITACSIMELGKSNWDPFLSTCRGNRWCYSVMWLIPGRSKKPGKQPTHNTPNPNVGPAYLSRSSAELHGERTRGQTQTHNWKYFLSPVNGWIAKHPFSFLLLKIGFIKGRESRAPHEKRGCINSQAGRLPRLEIEPIFTFLLHDRSRILGRRKNPGLFAVYLVNG